MIGIGNTNFIKELKLLFKKYNAHITIHVIVDDENDEVGHDYTFLFWDDGCLYEIDVYKFNDLLEKNDEPTTGTE